MRYVKLKKLIFREQTLHFLLLVLALIVCRQVNCQPAGLHSMSRSHEAVCEALLLLCYYLQVLAEAKAVDDRAASGEDVGPLCGLAFAVKDNIDVIGYATVAGNPAFEGHFPKVDSPLVTRLRRANGVVLGKVMHGLAEDGPKYNSAADPIFSWLQFPTTNCHNHGKS